LVLAIRFTAPSEILGKPTGGREETMRRRLALFFAVALGSTMFGAVACGGDEGKEEQTTQEETKEETTEAQRVKEETTVVVKEAGPSYEELPEEVKETLPEEVKQQIKEQQ
jgi:hypothetical protein